MYDKVINLLMKSFVVIVMLALSLDLAFVGAAVLFKDSKETLQAYFTTFMSVVDDFKEKPLPDYHTNIGHEYLALNENKRKVRIDIKSANIIKFEPKPTEFTIFIELKDFLVCEINGNYNYDFITVARGGKYEVNAKESFIEIAIKINSPEDNNEIPMVNVIVNELKITLNIPKINPSDDLIKHYKVAESIKKVLEEKKDLVEEIKTAIKKKGEEYFKTIYDRTFESGAVLFNKTGITYKGTLTNRAFDSEQSLELTFGFKNSKTMNALGDPKFARKIVIELDSINELFNGGFTGYKETITNKDLKINDVDGLNLTTLQKIFPDAAIKTSSFTGFNDPFEVDLLISTYGELKTIVVVNEDKKRLEVTAPYNVNLQRRSEQNPIVNGIFEIKFIVDPSFVDGESQENADYINFTVKEATIDNIKFNESPYPLVEARYEPLKKLVVEWYKGKLKARKFFDGKGISITKLKVKHSKTKMTLEDNRLIIEYPP